MTHWHTSDSRNTLSPGNDPSPPHQLFHPKMASKHGRQHVWFVSVFLFGARAAAFPIRVGQRYPAASPNAHIPDQFAATAARGVLRGILPKESMEFERHATDCALG